jgi:hypothetical protein
MARDAGKSHGFGRVSPVTHPSPYSPVQFRGRGPAGSGLPPSDSASTIAKAGGRRGLLRRAIAGIALVAVAAAGAAYFTLYRAPAQPPARTVVDAAMLAATTIVPAADQRS